MTFTSVLIEISKGFIQCVCECQHVSHGDGITTSSLVILEVYYLKRLRTTVLVQAESYYFYTQSHSLATELTVVWHNRAAHHEGEEEEGRDRLLIEKGWRTTLRGADRERIKGSETGVKGGISEIQQKETGDAERNT